MNDRATEQPAQGQQFYFYVAWRYLLERSQRISPGIVWTVTFVLWIALGFLASWLWFPLAVELLAIAEPIPTWFAVAVGLSVAFFPMWAIVFVTLRAVGADLLRLTKVAVLGVWAGLISLSLLGAFAHVSRAEDVAARQLPTQWFVLGAVALVLVLAGRSVRRNQHRDHGSAYRLVGLGSLALEVFVFGALLAAAGFGVWKLRFLFPTERLVAILAVLGAGAILCGVSVAGGLSQRSWRRSFVIGCVLLTGASAFVACYAVYTFGAASWEDARRLLGEAQLMPPMSLQGPVIGALAAIVLIALVGLKRYFFTFFSTVSLGGVALGSMALVIVLSVMSGFETDLREKILGSNAHILVTKSRDRAAICEMMPELPWTRCSEKWDPSFTEYRATGQAISKVEGVVAQSPYLTTEVVIAANNNYQNVIVKGVDPELIGNVTDLSADSQPPDALLRLWPLTEKGDVAGKPDPDAPSPIRPGDGDAGGVLDPAPPGFDLGGGGEPVDFSGDPDDPDNSDDGDDANTDETDPAPAGFDLGDVGDPTDFSGGVANNPDLDDSLEKALDELRARDPIVDDADYSDDADDNPLSAPQRTLMEKIAEGVLDSDDPIDEDSIAVDSFDTATEFRRTIPPSVAVLPGVLVGKELVKQINLFEGQEVKIVSPLGQDTPLGPVPRTKPYRVAGIFFTGMYEYDLKSIYVDLGSLQDFLDIGDEATGIEIRVDDPDDTEEVMARIAATLGSGYEAQDWKQLNRSLFSALKLEKIAMFLVLAIIILVASFSIIGNLIMVVVEKAKEIAILKTLGSTDREVMRIFITQGFFIGLIGTTVGVTLGLLVCVLGLRYGLPLDPDVYYIDRLPIHIDAFSIALVAVSGVAISVLATLYPAYKAAKLRPVAGLRYE